jgi:hypothetical protein
MRGRQMIGTEVPGTARDVKTGALIVVDRTDSRRYKEERERMRVIGRLEDRLKQLEEEVRRLATMVGGCTT